MTFDVVDPPPILPTSTDLLTEALAMRALYMAAERAILLNQSYRIGGQELTRADLTKVRDGRLEWEAKIVSMTGGSARKIKQVFPVDDECGCGGYPYGYGYGYGWPGFTPIPYGRRR